MDALGPLELIAAAVALMAAYAVRGTAGFGGQTVAVPLLTLLMPITIVVPAVTVLTVVSSIVHWLQDWSKIAWREIARLMPFTLLGVLIGARLGHYLAARIDQRRFNLGVGVLLMAIGTGLVFK
ncbi:MAG: sulfite exporter TauE/SafE family protein [Betaproteobacteria bacterium]|nr:sulfite exporter TauE/SafE family protein [Betaproteobacteria bacterium]MDH3437965.1 sulfite exporter TauE/SafE family protein [Betaproteobacteria bacterium]